MRDTDLAWAAGFIDGEGCIQIAKGAIQGGRYTYYSLLVSVAQLDPEPLHKLRAMFGGSIAFTNSKARKGNAIWRWLIVARQARAALEQMQPYFTVKRDESALAIEFQAGKATRGNLRHRPGADIERNEHYRLALMARKVERKGMAAA